jgi:hypothetical protein
MRQPDINHVTTRATYDAILSDLDGVTALVTIGRFGEIRARQMLDFSRVRESELCVVLSAWRMISASQHLQI